MTNTACNMYRWSSNKTSNFYGNHPLTFCNSKFTFTNHIEIYTWKFINFSVFIQFYGTTATYLFCSWCLKAYLNTLLILVQWISFILYWCLPLGIKCERKRKEGSHPTARCSRTTNGSAAWCPPETSGCFKGWDLREATTDQRHQRVWRFRTDFRIIN